MCNKSLTSPPCDRNVLCGISVRFQTLSPTHRQIAHALLTRPPLFRDRSPFTVRLECVKHAASVHPEPGSNSLKNCISSSLPACQIAFFQSFILASYFSTLCSKLLTRSYFFRLYLLFNFQGPLFCRSRFERSCSIAQSFSKVNTFFQIFLKFFHFFSFSFSSVKLL